jgi:AcrR family transcriptional regulator
MEITKQKILNAAKRMFLTEGYHKTTTTALSGQARVNKALINYYFKNKENLYNIVINEVLNDEVLLTLSSLNKPIPFYFKIKVFEDFRDILITKYPRLPMILIDPYEPGHHYALKTLKESNLILDSFEKELKDYSSQLPLQTDEPKAIIVFLLSIAIFPWLFKDILKIFISIDDKQFDSDIDKQMNELLYFINKDTIQT